MYPWHSDMLPSAPNPVTLSGTALKLILSYRFFGSPSSTSIIHEQDRDRVIIRGFAHALFPLTSWETSGRVSEASTHTRHVTATPCITPERLTRETPGNSLCHHTRGHLRAKIIPD